MGSDIVENRLRRVQLTKPARTAATGSLEGYP